MLADGLAVGTGEVVVFIAAIGIDLVAGSQPSQMPAPMRAGAAVAMAARAALTSDFSRRWYCRSSNRSRPRVR